MKPLSVIPLLFISIFAFGPAIAQNMGSEIILIQGGGLGNVTLTHLNHQIVLGDCDLCHNLFPQLSGSIERKKKEGKLIDKHVMEQCRTCHVQRSENAEKAGPTDCKGCHKK